MVVKLCDPHHHAAGADMERGRTVVGVGHVIEDAADLIGPAGGARRSNARLVRDVVLEVDLAQRHHEVAGEVLAHHEFDDVIARLVGGVPLPPISRSVSRMPYSSRGLSGSTRSNTPVTSNGFDLSPFGLGRIDIGPDDGVLADERDGRADADERHRSVAVEEAACRRSP